MKKFPSKYVEATYKMSMAMSDGEDRICFVPLRRSCVPCHMDTEMLAQIFFLAGVRYWIAEWWI